MDQLSECSALISGKDLLKALGNTTVHYFDYDVQHSSVKIPQRTCVTFGCEAEYSNMPYSFADDFVYEEDRTLFNKMYFDIIEGAETSDALFRNKSANNWCHVTITVIQRDSSGVPLRAAGIIEDLSQAKKTELHYSGWVKALSEIYHVRCYVNLIKKNYVTIEDPHGAPDSFPSSGNAMDLVKYYGNKFVHPDDHAEFFKKLNAEYIISHLNIETHSFSLEYRRLDEQNSYRWVRGTVILADALEDGSPHHILYTIQHIEREKEEKALLESSMSLMRETYYRIGCIDLNRNTMRSVTISKYELNDAKLFKTDFEKAIRTFGNTYVLEEYREKFLNIMIPARMKAIFDVGTDYIDFVYRRLENGVPTWVRAELIPLHGYSEKNRQVMWYVKNISDEKATEKRVSQNLLKVNTDINLRLEAVLGGISGGFKISLNDEKYTYQYISESAAKLFGYTPAELMEVTGNCAQGLVYPPDLKQVSEDLKRNLSRGGTYSIKYRVKCKDGSIKWIVDSGKKVTDETGKVMFYSLYHDVTELEKRNIELKDTLTMLNQIVSSLSCGIFAYRLPKRDILMLNDEAKRLFDIDKNETDININRVMQDKIIPEDYPVMHGIAVKLNKPGDSTSYEFRMKHKDGSVYRIQVISSLLQFADGSLFILSSMLDITKQYALTESIKEERSQYRDALISNCEYAFSLDLTEGCISDEFVTKHGVNVLQKLGLNTPANFDTFIEKWIDIFQPQFMTDDMKHELSREAMLKKYASGERTGEVEYYSPISNIYTRVTSLFSRSERNGHVMAVIVGIDTTKSRQEETRAKQALLEAYEAARRANSAKSDFLSRMSHDIRTPMNAIIGMTAIAGTHIDDKEKVADCLNKITVSSGHLLSLINEVLDMSKIESGKIDLNEEDFNLSDLVDNLISMVRTQIKAKNQNLKVCINDVEHEKVIGDKLRIQQSFLNLMSNAIKYTPEGGNISLYINEKKRHSSKVGRYEFIFEDTGIGMTEEFMEHIFEPFSRAADSRVSKAQGTGLGLAITDNLVRMMNGNIKVESELGKGSKFTVTISLKLQSTEDLSYDEFIDLSVLVADDEESACENACRMLDELGMKSEWVTNGREAIDKVVERHNNECDYFAVILDWKMPEIDGIRATKEIRRLVGPEVPIIIISAYDWSDIELEARAAGADAFISKPLFKSRLAHLFHDMISGEEHGDAKAQTDELKNEDFAGKRVLLVEDNELNSEIAQELLEMTGLEVECAENGQIAVDMFSNSPSGYYQMIFMDIKMPVMDGNEATRAIRALSRRDAKGIPIVAMTANAFAEDVQASLSAGMNEHIAKPLSLNQLVNSLRRWLY